MFPWMLLGLLLIACAPRPAVELEWLKDRTHRFVPDSLKAHCELGYRFPTAQDKFDQGSLNAHFYVVPHKRYRVELKGPLGIHIGSILWDQERWEAWLPRDNLHIKGRGASIKVPLPGLSEIAIHKIVGALWGEVLPSGWETAELIDESTDQNSDLNLKWQHEGVHYHSQIHRELFQVKSLSYLDQEYRYYNWSNQDSLYYPGKTVIRLNKTQLEVEIDHLNLKPKWKQRLWKLRVPPGAKVREVN